ncbi:MAG TPA: hypothetical protein VNG51_17980 [Ktedonobacteraceae bacterium]|nr:hypothetical protein [Ktedonobacteraceae bacterium]
MAKQSTVSGSFVRRFFWIPIVLLVVVLGVAFGRPLYDYLMGQLTPPQPAPPLVVSNPPYRPLIVGQFCIDGPSWYPASIARQAQVSVADSIDSLVTANSGGVHLFVSYIDSRSFQHQALTLNVPPVPAAPLPPVKPQLSDAYKQAAALTQYKKDYAAWQGTYGLWQKGLAITQSQVEQQTDALRSLPAHVDNTGASTWGCLFTASQNFQGVNGKKVLLIASPLMQNTNDLVPTGFTLAGTQVEVIFHNCVTSASVCAQNDANWRRTFMHYGALSVSFSSVQESQVQKVTL